MLIRSSVLVTFVYLTHLIRLSSSIVCGDRKKGKLVDGRFEIPLEKESCVIFYEKTIIDVEKIFNVRHTVGRYFRVVDLTLSKYKELKLYNYRGTVEFTQTVCSFAEWKPSEINPWNCPALEPPVSVKCSIELDSLSWFKDTSKREPSLLNIWDVSPSLCNYTTPYREECDCNLVPDLPWEKFP